MAFISAADHRARGEEKIGVVVPLDLARWMRQHRVDTGETITQLIVRLVSIERLETTPWRPGSPVDVLAEGG